MKILLIAYEYPPIVSAQALRWFYLANELAEAGVKIDILTTQITDIWGFKGSIHPGVRLHRCFPGPFIRCPEWFVKNQATIEASDTDKQELQERPNIPSVLLSRAYGILRDILNVVIFPDVRSEWFPFAWKMLNRLLKNESYDILISSHEPGVDVLLGLAAKQKYNIPWVVDLGDPLLAPYTPRLRSWLDFYVEGVIINRADHMIVTTEAVMRLLRDRHGALNQRFTVIPQGFDKKRRWFSPKIKTEDNSANLSQTNHRFKIVYTGTFYKSFRNPEEFFKALQKTNNIHLVIAGEMSSFQEEIAALGNKITVLNKQNHELCLELQRSATLLLNIGNNQSYQIPGKLFEYFGADRPILHLSGSDADPASEILARTQRGLVVTNKHEDIIPILRKLYQLWEEGNLDRQFDLSAEPVDGFSWESAAQRVHKVCERLCTFSSIDRPDPISGNNSLSRRSSFVEHGTWRL